MCVCVCADFIAYVILVIAAGLLLIFVAAPRYGLTNPLVYLSITASFGSLSVMGCKGLGVALKQSYFGENQLSNWLVWVLALTVVACILVQMIYLNKALDIYNLSVVTPLLFVIFTICVIVASEILFQEWQTLSMEDLIGSLCGMSIIMAGVFLLQAFNHLDISLNDLPRIHRDSPCASWSGIDLPLVYISGSDSDLPRMHRDSLCTADSDTEWDIGSSEEGDAHTAVITN